MVPSNIEGDTLCGMSGYLLVVGLLSRTGRFATPPGESMLMVNCNYSLMNILAMACAPSKGITWDSDREYHGKSIPLLRKCPCPPSRRRRTPDYSDFDGRVESS